MSALDFGVGNSSRYGTLSGPAVPDGDWFCLIWHRAVDLSGNSVQYAISQGTFGGTNSFHLIFPAQTSGFGAAFNFSALGSTGSQMDEAFGTSGVAFASDNISRLCIAQRNGGNLEMVAIEKGSTALPTVAVFPWTTNGVASGTWAVGVRSDLAANRWTCNPIGNIAFLGGSILTPEEMLYLAQGKDVTDIRSALDLWLPMREINAVLPDLSGNGRNLTMNGTGYATQGDFYGPGRDVLVHPIGRSPEMRRRSFIVSRTAIDLASSFDYLGGGGLVFAGDATESQSSDYSATGSGGLTFAGAATAAQTADYAFAASGVITFSGVGGATYTAAFALTASGGIVFGGAASATAAVEFLVSGAGGIVFGGVATVAQTSSYAVTGSGGLQFGGAGTASQSSAYAFTGSGGLAFGGAATAAQQAFYALTGSGGVVFSGTATALAESGYAVSGSGGIVFGGSAGVIGPPAPTDLSEFFRRRQQLRRAR